MGYILTFTVDGIEYGEWFASLNSVAMAAKGAIKDGATRLIIEEAPL